MPHSRNRYAESILKDLLTHSPIVGVLGQRQVGKTTLTEELSREYSTLDLDEVLDFAKKRPNRFLENRQIPFTIDECQLAPPLFPALKERVRTHPRKGQFILTGSVRFTSRKAIRESLTGRILNLELLPFSPAESYSEPLPRKLIEWIQARAFSETPIVRSKWLKQIDERFKEFLKTGGLPGICFYRDAHVRAPRFESHLETLLERDIRLLVNTAIGYRQLKAFLSILAKDQGQPVNYSDISRKIGLSPPSIKKLISAMEGIFLIRTLSIENQASPTLFLEDQGLASYLIAGQAEAQRDLVRGLFSCILPQVLYRPEILPVMFQYRTRGGARVDIAIRTQFGTIGIIPVAGDKPTSSAIASAKSFLAESTLTKVVIAHMGTKSEILSENILSIPYQLLISDEWV